MKYATISMIFTLVLSAWACGGQEKPPLQSENDLVDQSTVDPASSAAPSASSAAPASSSAAPASSTRK